MNNPFSVLESRLSRIEELILDLKYPSTTATPPPPADEFLSLKQAAEFLSIAPQTVYQNVKRIPHSKRFGKLFFRQSDLIAYLEEGAATYTKKGGKL